MTLATANFSEKYSFTHYQSHLNSRLRSQLSLSWDHSVRLRCTLAVAPSRAYFVQLASMPHKHGTSDRLRHLRYFVVVAEMAAGKVLNVISVSVNILQPHGLFTTLFRKSFAICPKTWRDAWTRKAYYSDIARIIGDKWQLIHGDSSWRERTRHFQVLLMTSY